MTDLGFGTIPGLMSFVGPAGPAGATGGIGPVGPIGPTSASTTAYACGLFRPGSFGLNEALPFDPVLVPERIAITGGTAATGPAFTSTGPAFLTIMDTGVYSLQLRLLATDVDGNAISHELLMYVIGGFIGDLSFGGTVQPSNRGLLLYILSLNADDQLYMYNASTEIMRVLASFSVIRIA
jgi:hypothetical protein